jgi:hypothetical protein
MQASILGSRIAVSATDGVHIFELANAGGTWQQTTILTPSSGVPNGGLVLGNNMLLVGDDQNVVVSPNNSGAVFAFSYNPDLAIWTETQKVVPAISRANADFGKSVAVSGPFLVVGADLDAEFAVGNGAAYVFEQIGGTWLQRTQLHSLGRQQSDQFGSAVAISGDMVLVSAPGESNQGPNSGSAYLFQRNSQTNEWSQAAKFHAPQSGGVNFGFSAAMTANGIAVGARNYGFSTSNDNNGAVVVYDY